MTLVAPSSGLLNLVSVWHVGNMAPFKPGERVWAGAPIAELPDVSTLRVSARGTKRSVAVLQPTNPQPFNWMRFLNGSLAASSNRLAPSPPWTSPQAGPYPEISISRSAG